MNGINGILAWKKRGVPVYFDSEFRHSREGGNPFKSNSWMPDQVRHDEFLEVPC